MQWSFQRIEKKYLLDAEQYEILRAVLDGFIEPDDYPDSTICNVYYDTPDHLLIRRSLDKPMYKEKFRLRSYGPATSQSLAFMEIKKKYDGIVYKRRVATATEEAMSYLQGGNTPQVNDTQIMEEIDWLLHTYDLIPSMYLAYDRLAFRDTEDPELRITFDRNIRYRTYDLDLTSGDYGKRLLPSEQVLMEIKIPGAAPVWLSHALSELKIFPESFSKYGKCYQITMDGSDKNMLEVASCA